MINLSVEEYEYLCIVYIRHKCKPVSTSTIYNVYEDYFACTFSIKEIVLNIPSFIVCLVMLSIHIIIQKCGISSLFICHSFSVCVYVCVCAHARACVVFVCTCQHVSVCTYAHTCVSLCVSSYMFVSMCVHMPYARIVCLLACVDRLTGTISFDHPP